mgnify:CR=1 FL=1
MNSYRTLAVAALAFSAFAAQADSAVPRDGDWNSYPLTSQTHSSLTREAVVADLVASRAAGTLPQDSEWYNVPAPLNLGGTALAATETGNGAVAASKTGRTTGAEQQNTLTGQRTTQVRRDIAHQSGAIGVVAKDFSAVKNQRIDRPGPSGALGKPRTKSVSLFLEGHRDIGPLAGHGI